MVINYLNPETQDILDMVSDGKTQRDRYILRTLSPEYIKLLKSKIPFTTFSKGTLSEINSLVPAGIFEGSREVAFMKLDGQKYSNLGIVMLGEFHNDNESPDSLSMYLAKKDENGIVLWKNLKNTPGFENVYKYGNSHYVQTQRIVPGASNDNKGSIAIGTNSYEILTATRLFYSKAEKTGTKENLLLKGILEDDYSFMDTKPIFKKVDSWSTKLNDLASGKLENVLFTSSKIHDANFLNPNTSMGEQYLVQRKLNNKVFEDIAPIFKRNSGSNRVKFLTKYDIHKRNYFEQVLNGETVEPYDLNFLRKEISQFNSEHFTRNIDTFRQMRDVFSGKAVSGVPNSQLINRLIKSEKIKGRELKKLLSGSEDYLGKRKQLISELTSSFLNDDYSKFNDYEFTKDKLQTMVNNIDLAYEPVQSYLINEMDFSMNSKLNIVFDDKYKRYLNRVNPKTDDYKKTMGIIERDIVREFYDKYNEKIDLYNVMMSNRSKSKISEVQAVADRVKFTYDSNGNIVNAKILKSDFTGLNSFKKDSALKWGYYKARNSIGATEFDSLAMNDRLKLAKGYATKNKNYIDLFKKESELSSLGKYDYLDSFFRTQQNSKLNKYEMVSGDILSRTNDKIISNINKDNSMTIKGGILFGNSLVKLNINLRKEDGFNTNDYIKEIMSDRQASYKTIDLNVQKFIENQSSLYSKNYKLQALIRKAQVGLDDKKEFQELNKMLSFLKGGRNRNGYSALWGKDSNGNLVYMPNTKDRTGITELKNYNDVYDSIIKHLESKYKNKVGYALYDVMRGKQNMSSITDISEKLLVDPRIASKLDNTTFMAILNREQIINTSGAAKQQGLIHGDTYLGSLGFAQPGLVWNKVTQRTFQAQDVLGEQVVNTANGQKTVSEINAEIVKRLGMSGVNKRSGRYTTEEMYKYAINRINERAGLNNSPYRRGETYKTFAIGDVNTEIGNGLNSFTMSFQEGMTASRSMILTTNSIRNKNYNIALEELDFDKLGMTKREVHDMLQTKGGLETLLSKVLNTDLYNTIAGRKKYEDFLSYLTDKNTIDLLDGSYKGSLNFYDRITYQLGLERKSFDPKDTELNRMKLNKEIYSILDKARELTGSVAKPTTSQGKNIITSDYVKTHNELKPELGFTIRDFGYNAQSKNIELSLENIGINTQGSKGQTTGAKFTISEIYDFMKVRNRGKDIYIDAIFNNKGEKRMQTGMIIHSALSTLFANVYESAGNEGVLKLKENMEELLNDMKVSVDIGKEGYFINETYLTRSASNSMRNMTSEEFEKMMTEPTDNISKMFTERGKEILDDVIKKYSSQYNVDGEIVKNASHYGVINSMQKAYTETYKQLGMSEIPFTVNNATVMGYADNTETTFGKGSLLLLKMASERVNSTASKKKSLGSSFAREMLGRERIAGYSELADYINDKNTQRLSSVLGNIYTTMNNSQLLKQIHKYKSEFDISQLNMAISETLNNGIMFNLDALTKDDYLLDEKDLFPLHNKLMSNSVLGQAIMQKQLGNVVDGKLENEISVVVNDTAINKFTKDIKNSLKKIEDYYIKSSQDTNNPYRDSAKRMVARYENFRNIRGNNLEDDLLKAMKGLESSSISKNVSGVDIYRTREFLNLMYRNVKNNNQYSLDQLSSIMTTGNIITTVNLSYDVDEANGSIVASQSLRKLQDIAQKNFAFNNVAESTSNFINKSSKKDKTIIEDFYKGLTDYYSGKTDFTSSTIYHDLFNEMNFFKDEKMRNRMSTLQSSMKDNINLNYRLRAQIEGANNFFMENSSKLGMSAEEIKTAVEKTREAISKTDSEIIEQKRNIYNELLKDDVQIAIKGKLSNILEGNDTFNNNRTFDDFFTDKIRSQFRTGYDLLSEYIKVPEGAERLFQKKGSITSAQKFKISSSFVANPLEGSNILNKFEELLFTDVKNKTALEKNISELQEFIGSEIVNERLFTDSDGINWLDKLDNTSGNNFNEGLQKARKIFNKNFADISEVTITDKSYMKAFRRQSDDWKDFYDGKGFEKRGFIRELGFLSRNPQQTINHFGSVLNITVDSRSNDLQNRFARATLTYLPKETNNAGIITVGKKTMLMRRGD